MKLKNIKVWLAIALIPIMYNACNEDKLNWQPLGETEASYFTEENHFEKGVYGIYAKLTDLYWYGASGNPGYLHRIWLLPGDDVTVLGNDPYEVFDALNSNDGQVRAYYEALYRVINRANTMIQIIDERGEGIYTTPNLKENHRGEALLLRGYANFMLWNFFGTAPVIKERIQETDKINPPSSSGNQLLDQAISDFQEAATLLPESWSENNRGRATKSSANGYLGKALVYRATVTKNNMDYTAAIAAFNQITDKALTPEFDDNFDVKLENNSESLFEYQANNPTGGDNVWLSNDFDIPIGSISAFYGYFEDIEQLYGNAYNATQKLYNAFEPTDPRRDKTVIQSTNERTPLKIQKYWTQDVKTGQVGSYNNTRMLRYADVLLLKAEALVQSGGSLAEAIALINQIRARARNSGPAGTIAPADYAPTEIDRNKVMDWVRNERFLELAAEEGNRWLDLRRWHLGGQLNLATWDFSSIGNEVDFDVTKHLYMPIPSRETDLNTNIVQNPGY